MSASDSARIVESARAIAVAANHAFIGTEHLLAAALRDPEGAAQRALAARGVSTAGLDEELLEGLPKAGPEAAGPPEPSRFGFPDLPTER